MNELTPVPVNDTPRLRKLLRQRCPAHEIVTEATRGWFKLINVQNMTRNWISFLVRGAREEMRGTYCYVIYFVPSTGAPHEAGILFLWDD